MKLLNSIFAFSINNAPGSFCSFPQTFSREANSVKTIMYGFPKGNTMEYKLKLSRQSVTKTTCGLVFFGENNVPFHLTNSGHSSTIFTLI